MTCTNWTSTHFGSLGLKLLLCCKVALVSLGCNGKTKNPRPAPPCACLNEGQGDCPNNPECRPTPQPCKESIWTTPNGTNDPDRPHEYRQDGVALIKARFDQECEIIGLVEELAFYTGPRTIVRWTAKAEYRVLLKGTAEVNVADFSVHKDGTISAILMSATGYELVRVDKDGNELRRQPLSDGELSNDPIYENFTATVELRPANESLGAVTARIAAMGNDVVVALRSSANSVVLHRYAYTESKEFSLTWRALVEPAHCVLEVAMDGGSHDVFRQLRNRYTVFLDADEEHVYVAASFFSFNHPCADLLEKHNEHFSESLESNVDAQFLLTPAGAVVSRFRGNGSREYSVVVGNASFNETQGIRLAGHELLVFGRSLVINEAGSQWDGFLARTKTNDGSLVHASNVDVDRGDVFLDAATLSAGVIVAVGASGWTQNEIGLSVSESAEKLMVLLQDNGQIHRIATDSGGRHNQLLTVEVLPGQQVLYGGLEDGPGTHSGDGDRSKVHADLLIGTRLLTAP